MKKINAFLIAAALGLSSYSITEYQQLNIQAATLQCKDDSDNLNIAFKNGVLPRVGRLETASQYTKNSNVFSVNNTAQFNNEDWKYHTMRLEVSDDSIIDATFEKIGPNSKNPINNENKVIIKNKKQINDKTSSEMVKVTVVYSKTGWDLNPTPAESIVMEYCIPIHYTGAQDPFNAEYDLNGSELKILNDVKVAKDFKEVQKVDMRLDKSFYVLTNTVGKRNEIVNDRIRPKLKSAMKLYTVENNSEVEFNDVEIDWDKTKIDLDYSKETIEWVNDSTQAKAVNYDLIKLELVLKGKNIVENAKVFAKIDDNQYTNVKSNTKAITVIDDQNISVSKIEAVKHDQVIKEYVGFSANEIYHAHIDINHNLYNKEELKKIKNNVAEKLNFNWDNGLTLDDYIYYNFDEIDNIVKFSAFILNNEYSNVPLKYGMEYSYVKDGKTINLTNENYVTTYKLDVKQPQEVIIDIPAGKNNELKEIDLDIDYGLINDSERFNSLVISDEGNTDIVSVSKTPLTRISNNGQAKLYFKGLKPGETSVKVKIVDTAKLNESSEVEIKVKVNKVAKEIDVKAYENSTFNLSQELDENLPANTDLELYNENGVKLNSEEFEFDNVNKDLKIKKYYKNIQTLYLGYEEGNQLNKVYALKVDTHQLKVSSQKEFNITMKENEINSVSALETKYDFGLINDAEKADSINVDILNSSRDNILEIVKNGELKEVTTYDVIANSAGDAQVKFTITDKNVKDLEGNLYAKSFVVDVKVKKNYSTLIVKGYANDTIEDYVDMYFLNDIDDSDAASKVKAYNPFTKEESKLASILEYKQTNNQTIYKIKFNNVEQTTFNHSLELAYVTNNDEYVKLADLCIENYKLKLDVPNKVEITINEGEKVDRDLKINFDSGLSDANDSLGFKNTNNKVVEVKTKNVAYDHAYLKLTALKKGTTDLKVYLKDQVDGNKVNSQQYLEKTIKLVVHEKKTTDAQNSCQQTKKDTKGNITYVKQCYRSGNVERETINTYKNNQLSKKVIKKYADKKGKILLNQTTYEDYFKKNCTKRVVKHYHDNKANKVYQRRETLRYNNLKNKSLVVKDYYPNSKTRVHKITKYNKYGKTTYHMRKEYFANGNLRFARYYTKFNNGKHQKREFIRYNDQKKRMSKELATFNKKGKMLTKTLYKYNRKGQLKSNNNGKATRTKKYYKNGKYQRSVKHNYTSKGKLKRA